MKPPAPFKVVDTLKIARKYFAFTSNRLNDLGIYLGLGEKIPTHGLDLWKRCEKGDKKAWEEMVKYNKRDVVLLKDVYLRLLPYMRRHPNLSVLKGDISCPRCGSIHLHHRGIAVTAARKYRRFQCQNCGGWGRDAKSEAQPSTTRQI